MSNGRTSLNSVMQRMTDEEIAVLEEFCSSERVAAVRNAVARIEAHVKEQEHELEAMEKLLRPKPELYGVVEMRDTYREAITKLKAAVGDLRAVLKNPVLFDTDANRHVIVHLECTERNMSRLVHDLLSANPVEAIASPMPLSSESM